MHADWKLPLPLSGFETCQISDKKYVVCGGNNGQQVQSKCFILQFGKDGQAEITSIEPMVTAREEFSLVMSCQDQKLYALGGYDGKKCLDSIESYDFETGKWEAIGTMDQAKRALSSVSLPDGIYVVGGYNGQEYLNSV